MFPLWKRRAGFDCVYSLHGLRHTALTNVHRASRELVVEQRSARHVSPMTTAAYTHSSDEDMASRTRSPGC